MQCSWYGTGIQPQWLNADYLIPLGSRNNLYNFHEEKINAQSE